MIPYFILLILSFLFCFVCKAKEKGKLYIGAGEEVSEKNFAIPVFFCLLWILLACRGIDIGKDTRNYQWFFEQYANGSFLQALTGELEPLFGLLNWLLSKLTGGNFQVYLGIVAAITIIPIALLYNQDKRHSYLKIILFLNMSVFVMLFSGIRQAIAMGIGLIAFQFVKKKKLILFLIMVVVAMAVHQSAFMLFFMYPLYYLKLNKKHAFFVIPLIALVFVFNEPIFKVLLNIISLLGTRYDDYVVIENTGAITMIVCFAAFTLFAYIIPDDIKVDAEFIALRNYLVLVTILQCFAPLHNLAMRMNYYYILFVPIVIPKVIDYAEIRWREVAKLAEIVLCVFFTLYFIFTVYTGCQSGGGSLDTYPYIPFWVD